MRILFVSGEVAPFTEGSETATLTRRLPEVLQESGDYEARIMMPRYGTISERRNRLHEVIRLSGADIQVGAEHDTLKVKVASIPGARLQVYFMDSRKYFKRKGVHAEKNGQVFADNPDRALFFARAVLETTRNLGWSPDVIHALGWVSSCVPYLVRTEQATDALFEKTKLVYTPDDLAATTALSADDVARLELAGQEAGVTLAALGASQADAVLLPPSAPASAEAVVLSAEPAEAAQQAQACYEQVLSGVPA